LWLRLSRHYRYFTRMSCPICASPAKAGPTISGPDRFQGTPGIFSVAVCSACGTGWTLPEVPPAELDAYYPPSYGYLQTSAAQRRVQRRLMDRALREAPLNAITAAAPGTLLDVGCGRGDLGAAFARRGWRVSGVEPSAQACAVARGQGVDAREGTLESVDLEEGSFDAVVMRHSLEHVPEPTADLGRVLHLLRPRGLLVISVPNFGSWERQRFGSAWFHLDLPRHRTHFTPGSLQLALSSAGFDVSSVETSGDAASLLATLQYRLAGRLFSRSVPALWAQYGLGLLLSPLRALLDRQGGGGPFLHAVARRPA
jgi:2-polyprenyl-3-methyl-5-hydroxy-6-metoxy-1,4-benzoquinol methylase